MLTDIWFTPGYTFANVWFSQGLGWRGPGRTPLPKHRLRAPPVPLLPWLLSLTFTHMEVPAFSESIALLDRAQH